MRNLLLLQNLWFLFDNVGIGPARAAKERTVLIAKSSISMRSSASL